MTVSCVCGAMVAAVLTLNANGPHGCPFAVPSKSFDALDNEWQ